MAQIIFLVLCSGVVGSYLSKPTRDFGDNVALALNLTAVLVNVMVLVEKLNVPLG